MTTVRCVAEKDHADFALRRAINAGRVPGPRIYTAGRALVCTGGHGHESNDTLERRPGGLPPRRPQPDQGGRGPDQGDDLGRYRR
ncbi:hypothetical protein V2I01_26675 [Micromonospora sp. BRA006-A]|nr:hypothetical protein [Micromonospora sp. BRA006-A]